MSLDFSRTPVEMTALGRHAGGNLTDWVRRHDKYEEAPNGAKSCCHG